jgi:hypothetical protein
VARSEVSSDQRTASSENAFRRDAVRTEIRFGIRAHRSKRVIHRSRSRLPVWRLAAEVLATILGLFLFGSFKYQRHKNALTYGMALIIMATFVASHLLTGIVRLLTPDGGTG